MIETLQEFHFLRPLWLLALFPAATLLWSIAHPSGGARGWERIVDAHLLRYLIGASGAVGRRPVLVIVGAAALTTVLALAGPTWSKVPHATYRAQQARVIVLSLAPTMDAADIAPSRLARARLKVLDILARQREGHVALIAYSAEPYTVSPLTEDAKTIAALVPILSTDLMPESGDTLSAALQRAGDLLAQANAARGDVIVVTDSPGDAPSGKAAGALRAAGHRVSFLGVGQVDGAPVPLAGGGFLKDASGAIVVHKLDVQALLKLAGIGGGSMATLSNDDSDLAVVLGSADPARADFSAKSNSSAVAQWRDEGPWLVLLLLPLVAVLFRRGWLVVVAVVVIGAAPTSSYALDLESLWLRKDQQAQRALRAEDFDRAAVLADDPLQKGEALYRAGKYDEAAGVFGKIDTPDGHYNRGNALAQAGRYRDAYEEYEKALKQTPNHADAKYNRAVIEEILKRKPPPQQQSSGTDQQEQQNKQQDGASQSHAQQKSPPQAGNDKQGTQGDSTRDNRTTQSGNNAAKQQATPQQEGANSNATRPTQAPQAAGGGPSQGQDDARQAPGGESATATNESAQDREARQAAEQWLGRVPDDPGGLLREKFRREHLRRKQQDGRGVAR